MFVFVVAETPFAVQAMIVLIVHCANILNIIQVF